MKSGTNKKWLQVTIRFERCDIEDYAYFFDKGATGVEEEKNHIKVYFPQPHPAELEEELWCYLSNLQKRHLISQPSMHIETIVEQDWNRNWKKNYKPVAVSDRILIKPSWLAAPEKEVDVVVEIDPAMAFGTGTHATTRLCLRSLEQEICGGESVLDIGTGTGILSIAAIKLGARKAVALDSDPVAAQTAHHNARMNDVSGMMVFAGNVSAVDIALVDVLVANVNTGVILNLLPLLPGFLCEKGRAILSGILETDRQMVEDQLQEKKWHFERYQMQEWLCYKLWKP